MNSAWLTGPRDTFRISAESASWEETNETTTAPGTGSSGGRSRSGGLQLRLKSGELCRQPHREEGRDLLREIVSGLHAVRLELRQQGHQLHLTARQKQGLEASLLNQRQQALHIRQDVGVHVGQQIGEQIRAEIGNRGRGLSHDDLLVSITGPVCSRAPTCLEREWP